MSCWHGVKNIARVRINGENGIALLDNGAQINTITPKYVSDHSLQIGPITDLLGAKVACVWLGNAIQDLWATLKQFLPPVEAQGQPAHLQNTSSAFGAFGGRRHWER